jgi:dTDP-4-dehydrorhamnose 3,5-epimerase
MIFTETKLKGSFIIELEKYEDARGFFARSWDQKQFEENGLNSKLVQCNISFNKKKGTLRGMHYQIAPHQEAKLVRCTKGRIFDVIIDLRQNSSTFKEWFGVELNSENHKMLYVPEGFAHGFQTLANNSEVFYQVTEIYAPDCARGILWNDPVFKISWPLQPLVISQQDLMWKPTK